MNEDTFFNIVTVGWIPALIEDVCDTAAAEGKMRFSHILHPRYVPRDFASESQREDYLFFRRSLHDPMPPADRELLASLERDGVPTIHNMILGDRVVSKLNYEEALQYATFIARRLHELFDHLRPAAVVTGFDAVHCSLAFAVATRLKIPAFTLNYSVIPRGLVGLCRGMTPGSRVMIGPQSNEELRALAASALADFESRNLHAPAYVAPHLTWQQRVVRLPRQALSGLRRLQRSSQRTHLKFTDPEAVYSVKAALQYMSRAARGRRAIESVPTLSKPPAEPYVLFGLHMQPESSIDVWAPFYSNQTWVIELLARSIPPTHRLLVKIHKSDVGNYSREQLRRMSAFPGVELVYPFADTRSFIERAAMVISIQGTMGLEAGLLGKPAVMLGDSAFTVFPSVSAAGAITDLPNLIRKKLKEQTPQRSEIVSAYSSYLCAFLPASPNDWTRRLTSTEKRAYVEVFEALRRYVSSLDPIAHASDGPLVSSSMQSS